MHYPGPTAIRLALDSRKLAISPPVLYLRFEISWETQAWGATRAEKHSSEKKSPSLYGLDYRLGWRRWDHQSHSAIAAPVSCSHPEIYPAISCNKDIMQMSLINRAHSVHTSCPCMTSILAVAIIIMADSGGNSSCSQIGATLTGPPYLCRYGLPLGCRWAAVGPVCSRRGLRSWARPLTAPCVSVSLSRWSGVPGTAASVQSCRRQAGTTISLKIGSAVSCSGVCEQLSWISDVGPALSSRVVGFRTGGPRGPPLDSATICLSTGLQKGKYVHEKQQKMPTNLLNKHHIGHP